MLARWPTSTVGPPAAAGVANVSAELCQGPGDREGQVWL